MIIRTALAVVALLLPFLMVMQRGRGCMNFKRIETVIELPEPKIILLNHYYDSWPGAPPQDELINKIRARTSSIIFAGGPYELLEVR